MRLRNSMGLKDGLVKAEELKKNTTTLFFKRGLTVHFGGSKEKSSNNSATIAATNYFIINKVKCTIGASKLFYVFAM